MLQEGNTFDAKNVGMEAHAPGEHHRCCLRDLAYTRRLCGAPNSPQDLSTGGWSGGTGPATVQDPKWVALKLAHRIRSGFYRNEPKGTKTQPSVIPAGAIATAAPSSYELSISNDVPNVYEPSDGNWPNNGSGTSTADDQGHHYSDSNFFDLCGPGAADIALWYWPNPPSLNIYNNVTDHATGTITSWNGTPRMRGYLAHLAWQIRAPGWVTTNGMMGVSPSVGVMLQTERDALNWEASGESSTNWSTYFYVVSWWNQQTETSFHTYVTDDIATSNVPLVVEVNAHLMPNWANNGLHTNHYITIIGYNDNLGKYYYTDTCGSTTHCGSNNDGGIQSAPQTTVWNAITNIPVNQSTGDGGWVW